jgi:diguanylate cyclase
MEGRPIATIYARERRHLPAPTDGPDDRHAVSRIGASVRHAFSSRPWFLPEGRILPEEVWGKRHRGMTRFLWAQVGLLYAFGLLRGYQPLYALGLCTALAVPAAVAGRPSLSRNVRSSCTSLGLVVAASIFVDFYGGATEGHFYFFVIVAFLTLYQAWLPFLLALGYVVVEHGVLGLISPRSVYSDPHAIAHPWEYAGIHGAFILAASFANVLGWRLTERETLTDGLTGLSNRTSFLDFLSRSMDAKTRVSTAVLYFDLDNFKDANDGFGHDVGDELLCALSQRVKPELRAGDRFARIGGDEFAVALCNLKDHETARRIAGRVLAAIAKPVAIRGLTICPSASIGVGFSEGKPMSAAELLRNADLAMYESKRAGGGRITEYKPVLHTVALRRTELEAELREALEHEEFELHYQPIVDMATERLVGSEALIRWNHPHRGLVSPMDFIPTAEASGMINPLGAWVIRSACRQAALWQQRQPTQQLSVSVNLSPRQLASGDLIATVADALADFDVAPSSLCLEVTEGSLIADFEGTLPILNALRDIGVLLALDDFGTGYSSLNYLKQLPVDVLKIDRSFVSDLELEGANTKIVLATIELAHALGISVTAEGVETYAQFATLRQMGADRAQGFLLSKPVAAEEMTRITDWNYIHPCAVPRPRDAFKTPLHSPSHI